MMPCKVCSDETVRSQVDRMVSEGISDDGISRALASVGIEIGKSSILRHRQNHPAPGPVEDVELPPDMVIPRTHNLEPANPMGDEAARLLAEVREQVERSDINITKDRLVRETLLGRIMESQLAITATALDRYQQGEGRYPLDMVRGLSTVGTLFEKTTLHSTAVGETRAMLFEREVSRLEALVRDDAKHRTLKREKTPRKVPDEHLLAEEWNGVTYEVPLFRFGGAYMKGRNFNDRMSKAWTEGIAQGKALLAEIEKGAKDESRAV